MLIDTLLRYLLSPAGRALLWLLVAVFCISLFGLGATPVAVDIANPPWDKLLHFTAYACLATLITLALGGRRPFTAAALSLLLACIDEGLQMFEPGRHPGFDDLSADALAISLVALLFLRLQHRLPADAQP